MKLKEWRTDKAKVKAAVTILHNPVFIEMLAVLQAENPVYYPLQSAGVTAVTVTPDRHLGRIEGACFVIEYLKSMGTLLEPRKEVPQTYGA